MNFFLWYSIFVVIFSYHLHDKSTDTIKYKLNKLSSRVFALDKKFLNAIAIVLYVTAKKWVNELIAFNF